MDQELRGERDLYSVESISKRMRAGELTQWDVILASLAGCEGANCLFPTPIEKVRTIFDPFAKIEFNAASIAYEAK